MRKRRAPVARPLPPSSWAIPVSETQRREERALMEDWDAYGAYLEGMGFVRDIEVQSQSHQSLARGRPSEREMETYALWHHPAGLIIQGHSYTTGGWTKEDGTVAPIVKKLGSASVYARLELGVGPEAQHRAGVSIAGSGGTDPQLDGSSIRNSNDTFHSNTDTLAGWLENSQCHGKFLPLEQWDTSIARVSVYLPNELIYPLTERPEDLPENEDRVHFDENEALIYFCDQLPQEVSDVLRATSGRHSSHNNSRRWMDVEEGIDQFSEILSMAKKRWRSQYDHTLLSHWHEVALGEHGEDPAQWRALEKGPAGLSLPVALLYAKRTTGSGQRLLDVMDAVPDEVLERWACVPDAGGYTLALHAINRLFCDRGMIDRAPDENLCLQVLSRLRQRLGDNGIVLDTEKRSVLGLATQFAARRRNDRTDPRSINACFEEFNQVIEQLEEWKLPWNATLKWRTYPNIMSPTRNEGMPHFLDLEKQPQPQDLEESMGGALVDQQHALLAQVRRKCLEALASSQPRVARQGGRTL